MSVVNALLVPVGIVAFEVPPTAVGLLVLATSRLYFALVVLAVGRLDEQLVSEETWIVVLLASALQLRGVVHAGLEEGRQLLEFAPSRLHLFLLDRAGCFHQVLELAWLVEVFRVFLLWLRWRRVRYLEIGHLGEGVLVGRYAFSAGFTLQFHLI